ncbi:iron ABC transporter substrate-binding protein [Serinicoccus sp. CUA-874]|uniref:siderophore ABC transporter substrate-binding protein n=1 Tax=Serinicoccus sp. CUA-874 TaxID=1517939 RepID=UPI0009676F6A|nr:ABC transporter substrate-binding protein [Serinicoccus sp. CUA-874]OLT16350.1 iron ABC transporter substrate-binding protein [Serinicoccus sp. CUA-874]
MHLRRPRAGLVAVATAAALTLAACGSDEGTDSSSEGSAADESADSDDSAEGDTSSEEAASGTVEVEDFQGTVEVPVPAERIMVTDNRVVRALDAWGVPVVAAPLDIFPKDIGYASDDSVVNLGNHGEPDLEAIVAADPDLVLTGYRFQDFYEDITSLVPEAAIVDTTTDYETNPLDEELIRQIELAGQAVQHEEDAAALVEEFEASIAAATEAYDSEQTVMGLITSGGDIGYVAPSTGRAIGPVFDVLGLTPALEQEGGSGHTGDDISVEAIAESNPDWIIVMDRDAAVAAEGEEYSSAEELIAESEALANVTAVTEGNIVYLPADFYLTEDIQAYTTIFNDMADAMGGAAR